MTLLTFFSNEQNLYREIILDHSKSPRNKREGSENYLKSHVKNPACGDEVTMYLLKNEESVLDVCHITNGCSICIASTSILSEILKNKTFEENEKILSNYLNMLDGNSYDEKILGDLISLKGISVLPARKRCATLGVQAYQKIFNKGDLDE